MSPESIYNPGEVEAVHKKIANTVLGHDMTLGQMMGADAQAYSWHIRDMEIEDVRRFSPIIKVLVEEDLVEHGNCHPIHRIACIVDFAKKHGGFEPQQTLLMIIKYLESK